MHFGALNVPCRMIQLSLPVRLYLAGMDADGSHSAAFCFLPRNADCRDGAIRLGDHLFEYLLEVAQQAIDCPRAEESRLIYASSDKTMSAFPQH